MTVGIAIIGAGPVGMTAAVALAQRGHQVTVFEALDDLSTKSSASTFHPPTLEMLETLGVVDKMLDQGLRVDRFQHRSRYDGLLAELDLSTLAEDTRFPYRLQLEQSKLTPILRERLLALGGDIRYGHRLTSLENHDDRVLLSFASRPDPVAASWVIGADGASSQVRQSLGIPFDGMTYEDRFLVVTTEFDIAAAIPGIAPVNYISDRDEWLVLLQIPTAWRVLFPVRDVADPDPATAEAMIRERLNGVAAGAGDAPILEWSLYRVHQRVAATFRAGRTLLIGDAAHINSPIGGMGMNSGIHDAFLIGTVLGQVCRGEAADQELTRAADDRRRFALDFVQVATKRNTAELALADPEVDARRRRRLAEVAADRALMREQLLESSMLASSRSLVAEITGRN